MKDNTDLLNEKRSMKNIVNEAIGVLDSAGYMIQEMQENNNYGKLVGLRMNLLRQKKFLAVVNDYIENNCK